MHRNKTIALIPSPMVPLSTSIQVTPADIMTTALSNLLTRLKTLHRMNIPTSVVCGGCHWIESPPVGLKERAIFHRLTHELTRVLVEDFGILVDQHIVVLMKTSVDECFERLLYTMEARDCTLSDLIEEAMFLDMVTHVPGAASAFPYVVHRVVCPPFMKDNEHELNVTASRITNALNNS
jgi:hypothetical protein